MKRKNTISTAIVMGAFAFVVALTSCQKEAGPAEKAGKAVDNATEKAGQQIEKAGDNIQDAAKGNKK